MLNLLVGNGVNCQFDDKSYSAKQIVLRILKNCDRADFPKHVIVDQPFRLKDYLGQLFLKSREILQGELDRYTVGSAEKEALVSFKEKYLAKIKTLRMTDICFEDYYLVHDLVCHSLGIGNPDQYYVREAMRMAYLLAIYNDGKLNQLYQYYPEHFINFLSSFDNIFSTNYDSNIEMATGKTVLHIHGQFSQLDDVYDEESLRNHLPDAPLTRIELDRGFDYLYCNAITTHSGSYKEFYINQAPNANACVELMAKAYSEKPEIKTQVDSWTLDENPITRNLGYAVQRKAANPELHFSYNYHFEEFENMTGELSLLGISPWNDFHIFRTINDAQISECTYYYYSEKSCDMIRLLLPKLDESGKLFFRPATDVWENSYGKAEE